MTEIKTKMPSTTIYLRQVVELESRATALYGGNNSKLMTELFDSPEYKRFIRRKWKEAKETFGVGE